MKKKRSVLVADDHVLVADALAGALTKHYRIVEVVTRLDLLEARISALDPDVVVLDLQFGKESVVPLIPKLVTRHPRTRFVVLTAHAEPVLADKVLSAGAMGYVVKESATVELRIAIEEALAGRTYLTPIMRFRGAGGGDSVPPDAAMTLSPRQRTILGMLRQGRTYDQVGTTLGISGRTVEDHIERIGRRVGIRGKAQLIRWSEQFFRKDEEA